MTATIATKLLCNRCGAEHTTVKALTDPDDPQTTHVIRDYPERWIAVTHYTRLQTSFTLHYCPECMVKIYTPPEIYK